MNNDKGESTSDAENRGSSDRVRMAEMGRALLNGRTGAPRGAMDSDFSTLETFAQRAEEMERGGITNPYFRVHEGIADAETVIDGKPVLNFCNYNYLGLVGHPEVSQAAKDAIDKYGTSVSASRIVSGERPFHESLERRIADLVGADDSVVFIGGFITNVTAIDYFVGENDLLLVDRADHASIATGAKLSGARVMAFGHNDLGMLERLLSKRRDRYEKCLIVVEGLYSVDGDTVDLPAVVELKKRYNCMLMVDEAHSMGVIGKTGRGIAEYTGVDPRDVDIWMGTLSKSFASCGGYIAGPWDIIMHMRYWVPGLMFSVGMPPPNAAAAEKAIEILLREPERVAKLRENAQLFLTLAREAGFDVGLSEGHCVIPIIVGHVEASLRLSNWLLEHGVNCAPLLPPAVPTNSTRLRFFVSSTHTEEQIRHTIDLLKTGLEQVWQAIED